MLVCARFAYCGPSARAKSGAGASACLGHACMRRRRSARVREVRRARDLETFFLSRVQLPVPSTSIATSAAAQTPSPSSHAHPSATSRSPPWRRDSFARWLTSPIGFTAIGSPTPPQARAFAAAACLALISSALKQRFFARSRVGDAVRHDPCWQQALDRRNEAKADIIPGKE
jgi:hypothetical protein